MIVFLYIKIAFDILTGFTVIQEDISRLNKKDKYKSSYLPMNIFFTLSYTLLILYRYSDFKIENYILLSILSLLGFSIVLPKIIVQYVIKKRKNYLMLFFMLLFLFFTFFLFLITLQIEGESFNRSFKTIKNSLIFDYVYFIIAIFLFLISKKKLEVPFESLSKKEKKIYLSILIVFIVLLKQVFFLFIVPFILWGNY